MVPRALWVQHRDDASNDTRQATQNVNAEQREENGRPARNISARHIDDIAK